MTGEKTRDKKQQHPTKKGILDTPHEESRRLGLKHRSGNQLDEDDKHAKHKPTTGIQRKFLYGQMVDKQSMDGVKTTLKDKRKNVFRLLQPKRSVHIKHDDRDEQQCAKPCCFSSNPTHPQKQAS